MQIDADQRSLDLKLTEQEQAQLLVFSREMAEEQELIPGIVSTEPGGGSAADGEASGTEQSGLGSVADAAGYVPSTFLFLVHTW